MKTGKSLKNEVNKFVYKMVEDKTEELVYFKFNNQSYMFVSESVCIPVRNSVDSSMARSIRRNI
jgi:hypothetical protein